MGGNAFKNLPSCAFPRMPPPVYTSLKARLLPCIQELYEHVAVPFEAPEKADHGDLDFVVFGPKVPVENDFPNVPHDQIKAVLGAQHCVLMDGPRTSNFAVTIQEGEWSSLGFAAEEARCRQDTTAEGDDNGGEIYYQVDINVCAELAEWKNVVFFHAYGDLGMILGLIARNNGFLLSHKGFKIYDAPNPPFELSNDFDAIMDFWGLSMTIWHEGFATRHAIFEWVTQTRLFDSRNFRTAGQGITKVKPERSMYAEFVDYVQSVAERTRTLSSSESEPRLQERREEALVHFGKKDAFEKVTRERKDRARLKILFSGSRVRDLAGLGEHWKGVKAVMDRVRSDCGGDKGVLELVDREGEDALRQKVVEIRDSLGLVPAEEFMAASEASLSETMLRLGVGGSPNIVKHAAD